MSGTKISENGTVVKQVICSKERLAVTHRFFNTVKKIPEVGKAQLSQLRKFINFYFETLLKLS